MAISLSISSEGINNRNRIILNRARAIWELDKSMGIDYDGERKKVISRVVQIEAIDEEPYRFWGFEVFSSILVAVFISVWVVLLLVFGCPLGSVCLDAICLGS